MILQAKVTRGIPWDKKCQMLDAIAIIINALNAVFSKKIMIKNLLFFPLNGSNFVWLKVNLQSNKLKALLLNV